MTDLTNQQTAFIDRLDEKLSAKVVNMGYVCIDNMRELIDIARATMQREAKLRTLLDRIGDAPGHSRHVMAVLDEYRSE